MVRTLPPLLAATMLAACSGQDNPEAVASTTASAAKQEVAPPAVSSATPGLTGQVSALTSAVSGLDMRVTDYGTVIDLPADALFAFDSADLTPGAIDRLTKSAQVIRAAPAGAIKVVGHTDSKGDDAYNQTLSEARARAVADWFGQQVGVRQRRFEVSGLGEKAPIAANETPAGKDDPAGRSRNRRVEVVLPKPS